MKNTPQAIVSKLRLDLRVFSILFSPYMIWLDPDHPFLLVRFTLGVSACPGSVGAGSRLVGLPARPPGLVPHVESSENRLRPFDRQLPNGAICAAVNLIDDECTPCDGSWIGIELSCVFHFLFPLIIIFDFIH
jgi:hypothetical protein